MVGRPVEREETREGEDKGKDDDAHGGSTTRPDVTRFQIAGCW